MKYSDFIKTGIEIDSIIKPDVYSGLIDPSFRVIDPPAGGNNPEGRSLLSMQ
jgi:hypothetical protein